MNESIIRGMNNIADKLYNLQSNKNDGRGVSCVRDICLFLRKDRWAEAKQIAFTDFDKIRLYPDIAEYVSEVFMIKD